MKINDITNENSGVKRVNTGIDMKAELAKRAAQISSPGTGSTISSRTNVTRNSNSATGTTNKVTRKYTSNMGDLGGSSVSKVNNITKSADGVTGTSTKRYVRPGGSGIQTVTDFNTGKTTRTDFQLKGPQTWAYDKPKLNASKKIKEDPNAFMTKVGQGLSNALRKAGGAEPIDYDQIDQIKKQGDYDLEVNPNDLSDIGVDQTKNWPTRFQHHQIGTDWSDTNITKQGAWKLDDLSNRTADSFGVDRQIFKKMRDYPDDIPKDNKFHSDPERRAKRQRQYDAYFHMHPDMIDGYSFNADNPYIQDYKKRKQWEDQPQRESTNEDGVIVPGVNTTVDVKPGQTEKEAAKFFGKGKPAELHKKARKNSNAHNLYNLGLVSENKKKDDKPGDIEGFDPQTAMDIKKLKAKYPHADNIMSALMAQTSQTLKNQYKGDQRRDEQDKKQVEQDKKHNTRFRELEQRIWNIVMKNDLKEGKK